MASNMMLLEYGRARVVMAEALPTTEIRVLGRGGPGVSRRGKVRV